MTNAIAEQIQQWFQDNVDMKELEKKVEATLEYVKRFNSPDENGDWNVWAYEIVDGHHGQYTVRIFLDEVLDAGDFWTNEAHDMDELMGTYDEVSSNLATVFNAHTSLPGYFWVGHNEADGSLGVFYSVGA